MVPKSKKYYQRILKPPKESFFLLGPRGTGKTKLLNELFSDAFYIDLLMESEFYEYLRDSARLREQLSTRKPGSWVIIDEVQRIPSLLNDVHRAIEKRDLKFVLSGSSARKLKRKGVNLLAGRALRRFLHPLVPEELEKDFDLEKVLKFGSLPIVWNAEDKKEKLKAYVDMYLKEEIQAEALVRNLPGFVRFLPVAALFHGQTLNVQSVARDAGIARTTVHDYFSILYDTLLAFKLDAFEPKLRVKERRHSKVYWIDPGLVRGIRGRYRDLEESERGPLFEGWIAQLLRAYTDYRGLFDEFYYWATDRAEVDFLLRHGDELTAIEVKCSERIRPEFFKGLRAIGELSEVKRRIVVYLGKDHRKTDEGIEILPLAKFLTRLQKGDL